MKDFLSQLWETWKAVGQVLGDFVARVLLSVFYFTLFMPFGLGVRLLSDRLDSKRLEPSWLSRSTRDKEISDSKRLS